MKTISRIILLIVIALSFNACTHNNGDIGDLFGTWKLETITIDGEKDVHNKRRCHKENKDTSNILPMLSAWKEQADMLRAGKIDIHDYNKWRYNFPKYDNTQKWVKIPIDLSDELK